MASKAQLSKISSMMSELEELGLEVGETQKAFNTALEEVDPDSESAELLEELEGCADDLQAALGDLAVKIDTIRKYIQGLL